MHDAAGLTVCLPAIAGRITEAKRDTCAKDEKLQGLSAAASQVLVKALV
jgi:hypothetical protein